MLRLFLPVLLLCSLPLGCASTGAGDVQDGVRARWPRSAITMDGRYRVSYEPEPDPIPLNEHFDLVLEVRRLAPSGPDEASGIVNLQVNADMPGHHHGMMTRPAVQPLGGGSFAARGFLFHMPGHWEIYVDVLQGDRKSRAVLNTEVDF